MTVRSYTLERVARLSSGKRADLLTACHAWHAAQKAALDED